MSEQTANVAFDLSPEQVAIRETIRDFAESVIRPDVMKYDESQMHPAEVIEQLAQMGFLGILVPEEYGGVQLGYMEYAIVVEELARIDPSVSLSVAAHNGLCTNHINLFGSRFQKDKYLTRLAEGSTLGAWGLTEPASGSDAAGMQSTAEKKDGIYSLNGTKNFITNGGVAEIAVIMAKTDKSNKKHGVSAFIVTKGQTGFSTGKKENKLGMRASETVQLLMDNVQVSSDDLIGIEGDGLQQAMKILEGGRISIAALSVGLAQGCLDACKSYVKQRKQFGKSLSEFQGIQFKIAEMATDIEAARLLTYNAAAKKDNGQDVSLDAPVAKLFASEIATKAASEAVQIFGGYGFVKDYPVEKFYRDVKLLTIGEGTSEIQKMIIAKKLLRSDT